MERRRLARPGLSYIDANSGRLVTESAELLDMKQRIRERWPNLYVTFDHVDRKYLVIQECEDGIERLALMRPYCDDRLLADIAKADPTHRAYIDPEEAIDKHNAQIERDRDWELEQIAGDAGERLAHAFKKDGLHDHENIYGPKPKPDSYKGKAIR